MKALVKYARGRGNVEIREVPEPVPGAGQVKIEVKKAGICGSDLHVFNDTIEMIIKTPVTMGHEFCGVVAEVGPGVVDWKIGDRVTSETTYYVCETCHYCRTGAYTLCQDRLATGFGADGAFADYVVVPAKRLHKLPDNVDFISAALCEPLSIVVHSIMDRSRIHPGDFVLVTGVGTIGLLAAQVARAAGGKVILSGLSADKGRLGVARTLGFDHLINVEEEDLAALLQQMTQGRGVDVVLECSGAPEAARRALEVVRKQGIITQVGLFGKPLEINFQAIALKELSVMGSFSHPWSAWENALKLMENGKIMITPMVTDVFSIRDWEKAFQKFQSKEGLKIILRPEREE